MRTAALVVAVALSLCLCVPTQGAFVQHFNDDPTGQPPPSPPWTVTAEGGNSVSVQPVGVGDNALDWADTTSALNSNLSARLTGFPSHPEGGTFSFDMRVPANELRNGYFAVDLHAAGQPDSLPMLTIGFVRSALSGSNPVSWNAGYGGDKPISGGMVDDTWYTFTLGWGDYVGNNPQITVDFRPRGALVPTVTGTFNNQYATGLGQTPDWFFLYSGNQPNSPNSPELIANGMQF